MATLRSVNTRFWEDPWVEELTPSDKLLFLYLLTNKYANLAGIYEITVRRISFETGLNHETIRKGLERFTKDNKAYFVDDNYLFLPNWLKNQNLNSNMKKGVLSIFGQLPKSVLIKTLGNHYQTILKDYQTLLNTLLKYEVEVEVEVEEEVEEEEEKEVKNNTVLSFSEFWDLYDKKRGDKTKLEKKYNGISEEDRKKIMAHVKAYKLAQPDKQFRKDPATYLNNRGWEDEIIYSHKNQVKQQNQPMDLTGRW